MSPPRFVVSGGVLSPPDRRRLQRQPPTSLVRLALYDEDPCVPEDRDHHRTVVMAAAEALRFLSLESGGGAC